MQQILDHDRMFHDDLEGPKTDARPFGGWRWRTKQIFHEYVVLIIYIINIDDKTTRRAAWHFHIIMKFYVIIAKL